MDAAPTGADLIHELIKWLKHIVIARHILLYTMAHYYVCTQVIDENDRYLDDVTSNYTLLAPNNVAIQKMLDSTSSEFWKDDSNVFTFLRCVTHLKKKLV